LRRWKLRRQRHHRSSRVHRPDRHSRKRGDAYHSNHADLDHVDLHHRRWILVVELVQ
jgi:hypothetical protein